jgi:hypothetical protein
MEAAEAVETVGDQAYEDVLATVIINKVSPISKATNFISWQQNSFYFGYFQKCNRSEKL